MKSRSGFTIVELLIVIVVIAILAAISIVAYNGIQNRANDSAVQSDLSSAAKKLAIYKIDNGEYPTGTTSSLIRDALETIDMKMNASAIRSDAASVLYIAQPNGENYALLSGSKSGKTYYISSAQSMTPIVYTPTTTSWMKVFPGSGNAANIGPDLGLVGPINSNTDSYYLFTAAAGLRSWNG